MFPQVTDCIGEQRRSGYGDLAARPPGMIGRVMESLRMRHQTKHAPGSVGKSGDGSTAIRWDSKDKSA